MNLFEFDVRHIAGIVGSFHEIEDLCKFVLVSPQLARHSHSSGSWF